MFLVKDQRYGSTHLVFTWEDPRKSGFQGSLESEVLLDYDMEAVHSWPEETCVPEAKVGRDPNNPKHYKVFKYAVDRTAAGYEAVDGTASVFGGWTDYVKLGLDPPNAEYVDQEDWYNYLDKVDCVARDLNKHSPWPDSPADSSRDSVAEWLAKQHFIVDPTIREIWYLPKDAPSNEIRFLEVSERMTANGGKVTPQDFGVEELGIKFRLSFADVSGDHLEQIRRDPTLLPAGWTLDGCKTWRRRDR